MTPSREVVQRALVRLKRLGYFPTEEQVREVLSVALKDIGTLFEPEREPEAEAEQREAAE